LELQFSDAAQMWRISRVSQMTHSSSTGDDSTEFDATNPDALPVATHLHVAQTVAVTEAEGPGRRFALWFQGCPLRCPGCCNPEMLPFAGGVRRLLAEVVAEMETAAREHGVEGITLLGGEPLAHAAGAARLARAAWDRNLSVMVFSGYTIEEARSSGDAATADLLACVDILVDGPYLREQPDTRRRWVGSANQRVHFLTARYHADDPRWLAPNTLEVRLRGAELTVNGFPAGSAVGLWRRPSIRPDRK
jgi:anaerobic ribonucleoside-triphosphate reductase activating protein